MANAIAFDTLEYTKKFISAGFTEKQAETQVEFFKTVMDEKLASKQDIDDLKRIFKQDIDDLRRDLKELELRMIIKMGAMLAACVAVITAMVKLL